MSAYPILVLENITKRFDRQEVLSDFNLTINDGEFFTILGPSGCGKTTVLRLIAGFEQPTAGKILLNGEDIAHVPAEKRPVNTVFQSYALFPHMTVYDNVAFGPKLAGLPSHEISVRVAEALSIVQLSDYASRKPHQLSGGQKQRVAIARALPAWSGRSGWLRSRKRAQRITIRTFAFSARMWRRLRRSWGTVRFARR